MIEYILVSVISFTLIGVIVVFVQLRKATKNLRTIESKISQLYNLSKKIELKIGNVEQEIHRRYVDFNAEIKRHPPLGNIREVERIVKEWGLYTPLLSLGPTSAQPLQQIVKVQELWKHYKSGDEKAGEKLIKMGTPGMDFIKRLWYSDLSKKQREWVLHNVLGKLGLKIYNIPVGTIFDPSIMEKAGVSKKGFSPGQVVKVLVYPVVDSSDNCVIKGKVIVEG